MTSGNRHVIVKDQKAREGNFKTYTIKENIEKLEREKKLTEETWTAKLQAYNAQMQLLQEKMIKIEKEMEDDVKKQECVIGRLNEDIRVKRKQLEEEKNKQKSAEDKKEMKIRRGTTRSWRATD